MRGVSIILESGSVDLLIFGLIRPDAEADGGRRLRHCADMGEK